MYYIHILLFQALAVDHMATKQYHCIVPESKLWSWVHKYRLKVFVEKFC